MAAHPCGRHVAVRIVRHRPAKQPSGGRRLHWRDDQNLLCAHRASLSIASEKRMIAAADSADDAARPPGSATGPARGTEIRDARLLIARSSGTLRRFRTVVRSRCARLRRRGRRRFARWPLGGGRFALGSWPGSMKRDGPFSRRRQPPQVGLGACRATGRGHTCARSVGCRPRARSARPCDAVGAIRTSVRCGEGAPRPIRAVRENGLPGLGRWGRPSSGAACISPLIVDGRPEPAELRRSVDYWLERQQEGCYAYK